MRIREMFKVRYVIVLLLVLLLAVACAPAEPEVVEVEVTRVVTETETIVETVVEEVEGEMVEVEVTRIVEVEVEAPVEMGDPMPITFTGWSLNEGASRDTIMNFVADYEAQNNVDISDVAVPWGETLNQLVLQTSGGTAEGAAQLDIAL